MKRAWALAALPASALPIPAAAQEGREEMQDKTRELGLSVGNVFVCLEGSERAAFQQDWQMMFDMILKDVGSDLAFVFATTSGYGASLPRGELDCAALEESLARTRDAFGPTPEAE